MNINEQFEAQQKELEALKAQVNHMRRFLTYTAMPVFILATHDYPVSHGPASNLTDLEELISKSPEQCLNSIKADAIDTLGNIMEREFGGHTGSFVRLYVDKLRDAN